MDGDGGASEDIEVKGARPSRLPWWPALDGLRAVAVIAVLAYHLHIPSARLGEVGVDIFFVLSGFLITSLLLVERANTGRVHLKRFWARRMLRLYPALAVVVGGFALLRLAGDGPAASSLVSGAAALVYVSNIWLAFHPGGWFTHTWTLALEEQFYLLWPIVVVVFGRAGRRGRVVAAALFVTGAIAVWVAPAHGSIGALRDGYVRALALPLGCLLAVIRRRGPGPSGAVVRRIGTVAGVGVLAIAFGLGTTGLSVLVAAPLTAVLAAVVIYALVTDAPAFATVLTTRPMVWVGRRSYGLYLWHYPIFDVVVHHTAGPHAARLAAAVVCSVAATAASYRWIERPFLRRKEGLHITRDHAAPPPLVDAGPVGATVGAS